MENPVCFPDDCEVVGSVVVSRDGSFEKLRFYIRGHHRTLKNFGRVRFIQGVTGPETEVSIERIFPTYTFEVLAEMSAAA